MNSMVTGRLFWISWCGATALTGLMPGFSASHAIMFGRFQRVLPGQTTAGTTTGRSDR